MLVKNTRFACSSIAPCFLILRILCLASVEVAKCKMQRRWRCICGLHSLYCFIQKDLFVFYFSWEERVMESIETWLSVAVSVELAQVVFCASMQLTFQTNSSTALEIKSDWNKRSFQYLSLPVGLATFQVIVMCDDGSWEKVYSSSKNVLEHRKKSLLGWVPFVHSVSLRELEQ